MLFAYVKKPAASCKKLPRIENSYKANNEAGHLHNSKKPRALACGMGDVSPLGWIS